TPYQSGFDRYEFARIRSSTKPYVPSDCRRDASISTGEWHIGWDITGEMARAKTKTTSSLQA
ncbi:MAG TPA: hypothetical protein VL354_04160, partial [Spirochaetia bacterium]|nr:hypothetical protein [Spirochaetia bacterium]